VGASQPGYNLVRAVVRRAPVPSIRYLGWRRIAVPI